MKIRYDPCLVEEVALLEVRRREERGDLCLFREYHALADPIYDRVPPPLREVEFGKLHQKLFLDLGFGKGLEAALAEFPGLETVGEIFVGKAATKEEEGGDLTADRRRAGIRLCPARFFDPENLVPYLRHEFQHVADMLDPAFGYGGEDVFRASSPAEANLVRNRYRLIWSIYVDGRLQRQDKETISDREGRRREFEASYPALSPSQRVAAFESLWEAARLTHAEMLEMANDPGRLLKRATGEQDVRPAGLPLGSLCPLCRFPAFHWAGDLTDLPGGVLEVVKKDFPHWEPHQGACERCVEVYRVTVGA